MRPGLAAAALLLALAGCAAPGPAGRFAATGSQPVAFVGYDYAAAGPERGDGTVRIDVDATTDQGLVVATFTFLGRPWRVTFERFAETRPFQEGGVRNGFDEHGASGNGDALLPQFHALSAGWGFGPALVDSGQFLDPATGENEFALHYMVTGEAPRDPATLRVTKRDGTTPYDPAGPADATTSPGTRQILLNVQSRGPGAADANLTFADQLDPTMEYAQDFAIPVNATPAALTVNLTLRGQDPVPPAGLLQFLLLGPDQSTELGRFEYSTLQGAPGAPAAGSISASAPLVGNYTLRVRGQGVLGFEALATVDHPPPVFLHVVYTDVQLG